MSNPSKEQANLPKNWEIWCKKGKYSPGVKRKAVLNCIDKKTNEVRGYFSNFILDPTLDYKKSLYPSIEHLTPKDKKLVVEARIINDMKSHLDEREFWEAVCHLCAVGIQKGEIKNPSKNKHWKPKRDY
jgi:hypothetical protein